MVSKNQFRGIDLGIYKSTPYELKVPVVYTMMRLNTLGIFVGFSKILIFIARYMLDDMFKIDWKYMGGDIYF